jgi:hypothetical protein
MFSSAAQAADYYIWRLQRLTERQKVLTVLGRPESYDSQRAGGFALLATGAGLTLGSLMYAFINPSDSTSSEDSDIDSGREIGLLSATLFGIGLVIGGAVWLSHLKRGNPYREEIAALHKERKRVTQDVQRARRQARIDQRVSFDFERLQVRF